MRPRGGWEPSSFAPALLLSLVSLCCWGSWSNTLKAAPRVPFAHYCVDFALGAWGTALLALATIGGATALHDRPDGSTAKAVAALVAGAVFNAANVLLVAGIGLAGLSVAFPVGIGMALVMGTLLTHVIDARGHRADVLLLGVGCACVAILLQVPERAPPYTYVTAPPP